MTALLHLSMLEALRLWSDLEQALHGTNGYGGNVAEIYAYRFGGFPPGYDKITSSKSETDARSGLVLHALLSLFLEENPGIEITVNGASFADWGFRAFDHRVRVAIYPAKEDNLVRRTRAHKMIALATALDEAADRIERWIPYARDPHEADDGAAEEVAGFRALAAEVLP